MGLISCAHRLSNDKMLQGIFQEWVPVIHIPRSDTQINLPLTVDFLIANNDAVLVTM